MKKSARKLLLILVVLCLSFIVFNSNSLANNDVKTENDVLTEFESDTKILIENLVNLSPDEQNSLTANSIRAKLTGLSIQEIKDFRSKKVPFYLNNAFKYNVVFNEENESELLKEIEPAKTLEYPIYYDHNNITGVSLRSSSITPISEGKYNDAISPNNLNQNCYGYAIGQNKRINPGYFAYNSNTKIDAGSNTLVSIDKIKDYVIADLKHLGQKPVIVSWSYVPASNEQVIVLRKGRVGSGEDYHFMLKHKLDSKWWHKPGTTSLLRLKANSWGTSGWVPEFYDSERKSWGISSGSYNSKTYYIKYNMR